MVMRWVRHALVLFFAALSVQSVRVIARVVTGRRPVPRRPVPIPEGPLLIRGTPRVVSPTFEPYGAL